RFPDMTYAYDRELRALIRRIAEGRGLALEEGVYAGVGGPSYETPAEVRMLGRLGGDAVGMSTVLEVTAARHMGMRCAGMSLITNPGAGLVDEPLDHQDVLAQGAETRAALAGLLEAILIHPDLESTAGS
ncbi:MAG: purine-nucleoside phosphorylase, partial [Acidobacteriota bacterium]